MKPHSLLQLLKCVQDRNSKTIGSRPITQVQSLLAYLEIHRFNTSVNVYSGQFLGTISNIHKRGRYESFPIYIW